MNERESLFAMVRSRLLRCKRAWEDGFQKGWRARKHPVSGEAGTSSADGGAQAVEGRVAETGIAGSWALHDLIAERDEAISLLQAVVAADRQDTHMGYPIPGDSCLATVLSLRVTQWLDRHDPTPKDQS